MSFKKKCISFCLALTSCLAIGAATSLSSIDDHNNTIQIVNDNTTTTNNVITPRSGTLSAVHISGIKWKYKVGESALAVAVITPSTVTDVTYDWYIGGKLVPDNHRSTISFPITESLRNKYIYVIAKQSDGTVVQSSQYPIAIEKPDGTVDIPSFNPIPPPKPTPSPSPSPTPPSKTLIDRVNEQRYNITPITPSITRTDFNNITPSNLLGMINIPTFSSYEIRQLSVVSSSFRRNEPYINFQLYYNGQTSYSISVKWNVIVPAPPASSSAITGVRISGIQSSYRVGDRITATAYPSFSGSTPTSGVSYRWTINNVIVSTNANLSINAEPEYNYSDLVLIASYGGRSVSTSQMLYVQQKPTPTPITPEILGVTIGDMKSSYVEGERIVATAYPAFNTDAIPAGVNYTWTINNIIVGTSKYLNIPAKLEYDRQYLKLKAEYKGMPVTDTAYLYVDRNNGVIPSPSTPPSTPQIKNLTISNAEKSYNIGDQVELYAEVEGVDADQVIFDWEIIGTSVAARGPVFDFTAEKEYNQQTLQLTANYKGTTKTTSIKLVIGTPFIGSTLFWISIAGIIIFINIIILVIWLVRRRRRNRDSYYY